MNLSDTKLLCNCSIYCACLYENSRWDVKQHRVVFPHSERGAVSAEHGPVQSGDTISGPEVQVSSSTAQNFNQITALLQLNRQSQRTLWDTNSPDRKTVIIVPKLQQDIKWICGTEDTGVMSSVFVWKCGGFNCLRRSTQTTITHTIYIKLFERLILMHYTKIKIQQLLKWIKGGSS